MTSAAVRPPVGGMLREWRRRRRLSQFDLALESGVSSRHLSFVETGWPVGALTEGVAAELLEPPVNVLRLSLHPDGLAHRIVNLHQWRTQLLDRLAREATASGDPALRALHEELAAYPAGEPGAELDPAFADIAVPLRLRQAGRELAFLSTATTFGTAVDITVAELSIESFFPADAETAEAMRALV